MGTIEVDINDRIAVADSGRKYNVQVKQITSPADVILGGIVRIANDEDPPPPFADAVVLKCKNNGESFVIARPYCFGNELDTVKNAVPLMGCETCEVTFDYLRKLYVCITDLRGRPYRFAVRP